MGVRKFRSIEDMSAADEIRRVTRAARGLKLLVLYGSRARGDAHTRSDWDYAFIGEPGFDADGLMAKLAEARRTDTLDLADLTRASGLLRFNVARDGVAIFEDQPGLFEQFRLDAIFAWLDMAGALGPAYADRLERLAK